MLHGLNKDFAGVTRRFCGAATGVNEKAIGHADLQTPLVWRDSPGGEQTLRREQLGSPTFGWQKKCIGSKTETGFTGRGSLEFSGEMENVTLRKIPSLRKCEESVAGVYRRALLNEDDAIPGGLRSGEMETATSRQAQL